MYDPIYIGIGAAFGGMMRLFLGSKFNKAMDKFPHGTFIANVLGSLLIGLVAGLAINHLVPHTYHLLIATGFCGALTTFSTFSLETLRLANREKHILVILYIVLSALICLLASVAGVYIGGKL